jgi:hypothetical protein
MQRPYCPVCGDNVADITETPERIELQPCGHAVTVDSEFWKTWGRAKRPEPIPDIETAPPAPEEEEPEAHDVSDESA